MNRCPSFYDSEGLAQCSRVQGHSGSKVGTDTSPCVADGMGSNRELPHLGDAGQGVHRALPHLGDAGQGEHSLQIAVYMRELSHRLERVRITCGSWERVVQPSATRAKTGGDGSLAIFLDPPYATSGELYAGTTNASVASEVARWCLDAPEDLRVILCGYDDEHAPLESHGWERVDGKSGGGAGYSTRRDNGRRERLWMSPACIGTGIQDVLDFGEGA